MIIKPFDELEIGETLKSRGRTISEADVVNFCYMTGNWEELHANEDYARKTEWGGRLVQGRLIFSLVSGMLPLDSTAVLAFYGVDKIRFTAPVKIGDTIHFESTVTDKVLRGEDRGVVTVEVKAFNQRDEVVMVDIEKILVRRQRFV